MAAGSRMLIAAGLVAGTWCAAPASAADTVAGALPGDDALSCEQIYAQGAAESQREQEERGRKSAAMARRAQATAAGGVAATLLAGVPGVGPAAAIAANEGAKQYASDTIAQGATAPPVNARKDRLRQLWAEKRCAAPGGAAATGAPDAHGRRAGDDAMTCAQIGAELAPYAERLRPNLEALGRSQQEQFEHAKQRYEERTAENAATAGLATAGAYDPTGLLKRAYQRAVIAQAAKDRRDAEAEAASPLAQRAQAERATLAGQAQELQGDARVQHLLALSHAKGCDK